MSWAPTEPPLTRGQQLWRIVVTALIGLLLIGTVLVGMPDAPEQPSRAGALLALDLFAAGPISLVLLWFHRRWPLPIAYATLALSTVSAIAGVASMVCLVSVSTRRRTAEIVPLAVGSMVAGYVYEFVVMPTPDSGPWWVPMIFGVVLTGALVAWGLYLGTRRQLAETERQRIADLEREHALRIAGARTDERARIAREMHDIVGHRISLIAMHAGALTYRDDLTSKQIREEAEVIQESAVTALAELRQVLGVLREQGVVTEQDASPLTVEPPQPTIDDLGDLVEQARRSGQLVQLTLDLGDERPSREVGRHVYRTVQECLTNARKHATGAAVAIRVTGRPGDELVTQVSNGAGEAVPATVPASPLTNVTPAGSGLGLVGIAERAAIAGGRLEHGSTRSGGFQVRLTLPWAG